jgi:hypothetical protein
MDDGWGMSGKSRNVDKFREWANLQQKGENGGMGMRGIGDVHLASQGLS